MRGKIIRMFLLLIGSLVLFACQPATVAEEDVVSETVSTQIKTSEPIREPTQVMEFVTQQPALNSDIISLWHPFSGQEAETIDILVSRFNEEDYQVEVVATSFADNEVFIEAVLSAAENGMLPDLIIGPSPFLHTMMRQSDLAMIDAEQEISLIDNFEGNMFPAFWGLDVDDGERFGVPYLQHGSFLFYNSEWAQELGFVDKPSNPEEFRSQTCMAFNQNRFDNVIENDGTGGYFYPADPIAFLSWLRAFNGGLEFNNRGEIILTTSENEDAIKYLFRLFVDDCAWWTNKQDTPFLYFKNRNSMTYSGWSQDMLFQTRVMLEAENNDTWLPISYPSVDGKPIVYFENYSFAIIEKNGVNTDTMLPFIQWMVQPDQHLEMVYQTAAFPLTAIEIQEADETWGLLPVWRETLQYIPFLEPLPNTTGWYYAEKILDDLRWQIIQFGVTEESLSTYLEEAESLGNSMILNNTVD